MDLPGYLLRLSLNSRSFILDRHYSVYKCGKWKRMDKTWNPIPGNEKRESLF